MSKETLTFLLKHILNQFTIQTNQISEKSNSISIVQAQKEDNLIGVTKENRVPKHHDKRKQSATTPQIMCVNIYKKTTAVQTRCKTHIKNTVPINNQLMQFSKIHKTCRKQ